ncbi:MAG: aminotransferase class IV [Gemmatimonadota bacterium]
MSNEHKLTPGAPGGQGRESMAGARAAVWLDGRVLDVPEPLEGLRRTVRYGDGLFATLRIEAGRILDAELHAARLLSGAAELGLNPPTGFDGQRQIIERLQVASVDLGADGKADCVLRCQWSASGSERGFGRSDDSVALIELAPVPATRVLKVRVLDRHVLPRPAIPHVKSCSAVAHVIAASAASSLGVEEAIRVYDGWVAEGVSANLFFELDDRLLTPEVSLPLYPGIVRQRVIEQAGILGIEVIEGRWTADELRACDGAFLTGSVRGVEHILALDDRPLAPTPLVESVARATSEARRATATALHGDRR